MDAKLMMDDEPMTHRKPWSRSAVAALGVVAMIAGVCVLSPVPLRESITGASRVPTHFEWVEARASSWAGGADLIIAKLKEAGVKRGQIISIDARNNNEDGQAIFSAYYSKALMSKGDLNIKYEVDNAGDGWATFYDRACAAAGSDITDLISITSSINEGGRSVTFVFRYDAPASRPESGKITWVESRSQTWNGAATDIIAKIKATGAKRGQVLGIDAHNNGCGDSDLAIFSAYVDLTAPGYGNLDIEFKSDNTDKYGWATFYNRACARAGPDTISITSSCNMRGGGVTYGFSYK